ELTCYYKEFGDAASWYRVLYTISSAAVIILALYLIFKIFWLVRKQNGILEQLETNRSYGERLITDDAQLRAFRHDYKNHVIVINSLLSAGRTDEAREYLSSLSDSIDGIVSRISSGNFVADALLNNKAIAALASDGELRFEGRIPESVVPNADLCAILANLLDNAIETIRKNPADKRTITVTAGINKNDFFLKIENPAPFSVDTKTTKTDKRNHGLGIKNARRAAERNDGTLVTTVADGVFRAFVTCTI
ncbi:MAG: GHKL domain-containing protein, partial [Clostridia bacterium]|nr:GHKL domain-containing protein [Clostridia bacterium]